MDKKTSSGTTLLNPETIFKKVGVKPGQTVADLGCGSGYFTLQAARMIGDEDLVYGVDILPGALSSVESKAKLYGLSNVQTVWADLEVYGGARPIKDQSIDVVLLIQLLFQVKNRHNVFKEVSRVIKPDGLLLVIEWKKNKLGFGPKDTGCLPKEEVKSIARTFGFKVKEEIKVGPYHYGLVFERA